MNLFRRLFWSTKINLISWIRSKRIEFQCARSHPFSDLKLTQNWEIRSMSSVSSKMLKRNVYTWTSDVRILLKWKASCWMQTHIHCVASFFRKRNSRYILFIKFVEFVVLISHSNCVFWLVQSNSIAIRWWIISLCLRASFILCYCERENEAHLVSVTILISLIKRTNHGEILANCCCNGMP